jgi:hypothetical protein
MLTSIGGKFGEDEFGQGGMIAESPRGERLASKLPGISDLSWITA